MRYKKEPEIIEVENPDVPDFNYSGPLKDALDIANFYGFKLIKSPKVNKEKKNLFEEKREEMEEKRNERLGHYENLGIVAEEKAGLIEWFINQNLPTNSLPIFLAHTSVDLRKKEGVLKLEVLGSNKTLAEAFVIHVAKIIIDEKQNKKLCVKINSMGEEDSEITFREELTKYLRDHINVLDPECREAFGYDPYEVFQRKCESKECARVKDSAPSAIAYLSEHARKHFMEIIEHFEMMDMLYEIEPYLFGHGLYKSRETFEIHEYDEDEGCIDLLAKGERYEDLNKILGFQKVVPSVTVSIRFKDVTKKESYKKSKSKKKKSATPLIHFIQLGPDARKKSLEVLEELRKTKIPLTHAIFKDDMKTQKGIAKFREAPYWAILGQKETAENSIIIRDVESRKQDTVPIPGLLDYAKKYIK